LIASPHRRRLYSPFVRYVKDKVSPLFRHLLRGSWPYSQRR
jgi:hypothetical protein